MKGTMKVVMLLIGVLLISPLREAAAQADVRQAEVDVNPVFFFDAIVYASDQPGNSRIDFYVQVPYYELRFTRESDFFAARYDVTLNISRVNGQIVQERSWSVDVHAKDIAQTTSQKLYSLTQRDVDVEPGQYRITLQVKDQDSKKVGKAERSLLVTNFAKDSLSLSDVMLVSRLTTSANGRMAIVPNIRGSIGTEEEAFFLFFEVYNKFPLDSVDLSWKIFSSEKKEMKQGQSLEAITGQKTQSFLKLDSLNLPVGIYLLTVDARPWPDTSRMVATTSRSFSVQWADMPFTITDIDKAIDELRYIADAKDLDYVRGGATLEERRKRFVEFWAKRDPDPSTPRNELMEEYYRRVDYANKHFSHYLPGWKTDMGMVYIRFGPPENIERHPFDMNTKPYEVWYYYQLERQFIFVDETGFGDYRLRYPTTDLWGRVR